jgi:peptide/nickel transport system permease protein
VLWFVLRRLAVGVVLIVTIAVLSFFLLYATGGDVGRRILGAAASAETVAKKNAELGVDRPVLTQFGDWASSAVRGDFGRSWYTSQSVSDAITGRLPVTLSLVIGATALTAVVGVVFGVLAARRGGWIDGAVQVLSVLGIAIPGFLVALGLVFFFAIRLDLVDPTGYTRFSDSPSGWLSSILLPVIALSIASIVGVAQQVRSSMLDVLRQDYVRTLRSRGLSERRVVYGHALRNAAGPSLSILGLQFVGLLGGAVLIEQIFAIPGIGQITVAATLGGDVPLVLGVVLTTTVLVIVLNLVVDLLQGWLNPKVRRA